MAGRAFSVAYDKVGTDKYKATCSKANLEVDGASPQQALFNMQRALEFVIWSKGEVEGVRVGA